MALVLKDRVKQTAAAPGTGTITLSGSVTGFQSFSVIGNGNTTYFAIYDPVSGDWEVNYGTYTSSGTTLTRNASPLSSSAGGALVNFTGVVDVFVTYPSENAVWRDTSGVVAQQSFGAITATSAALTSGTISTAPVNNTDIVNKAYADAIASGIHFHEAVDLATTAALPANTYNNGTSGVGATLTANANGALSVDSTLTVAANRILVKNEAAGANNGVYVVTQVGSAGTPYILTRATDFDSAGTGVDQIDEGDFFLVTSGVVNLNTAWVQQTAPPIVVGTTALVFQQFSAPITYTAGTGLNESPTYTFNIATTGVSAATYGSASTSATIAVNAQGQITSASNTTIAINGTQVSGNIAGQAGSVANALTAGTYLTSGGTYDGSAARTFAVDATDANTASKVVARDSSGNFSAGTITATLSGAATSAGTATNIAGGAANQIPYQTGAATTSFVVAPTVAGTYLNWNGSSFAYTAISLPNNATFNNGGAGDASGTTFNGSAARTISYNTVGASPLAGSSSLTTTGTVTSGTWSASFGAVSGANLTSLTAANISGTVALANGGTASSTAGGARTSLGATTLGSNLFTITNPSAVTFPRFNADNTVSSLDAATFRSAIGAGTSSTTGTVTSITAGTYLTGGTITTSGTLAVDATTTNTASKVVARDASGNFSAGTITATLSGNASTATSATTAGTITSQANSATITATSANTASQIVLRDASGNFSAGTITAALSGNASTASALQGLTTGASGSIYTDVNWSYLIQGFTTGGAFGWRATAATSVAFSCTAAGAFSTTTVNGFTPSATSGLANRLVATDSNGYIFNSYFNSTDNAISSGVTAIMSKASDNYYRSASAAAVATFISGQSMSISGNATNVTGTVAVGNGGTGQTTGYKLFDATYTVSIDANVNRTAGMYGSYGAAATNTPTNSGILYNFMSGTGGAGDGGQFWQDYGTDNLYLRKRWGGGFGGWLTILSASNYNSYAPTLTGTGASGTWSINVTGSSASATFLNSSNYINKAGSSGNLNTDFSNTPAGSFRYNGDDANITNSPGGTWWIYQNMRHTNASNLWGTQVAWGWEDNANRLATRNVSGGGFGGWVYYLNSNNYTSYAPSLTGSGASGTWGIAITGNAGNTSSISNAVGGSYVWTNQNYFRSNQNTSGSGPALQAYSDNASGAIMAFHRGGAYAVNFGLDSDNVIRIGGWSAPGNLLQMNMTGNLTMAGNVTAYSDERLKKDWALLPDDFIEQLAKVKSGTYTRIDSEERQVGVSAQGLQKFLDEAVQTDAEGMLSVNYGGSALAACVELAKRVVEQDARIARLETLVSKLIGD